MAALVFVAYDAADPAGTALGTLTEATDKQVTVEDDGIGSGSFSINASSSQAAWAEPGNYVAVWRDTVVGDPIAGFWVEPGDDVILSPDEEGGEEQLITGRGPIVCLDEALVWHRNVRGGNGVVETRRGRWRWRGGVQLALPLLRLLREAKARGAFPFVTWDFTSTHDSDGTPWPAETEVRRFIAPIGPTLLEMVTMFRAAGLRIMMDASFRLSAWPEEWENDLSASIAFTAGVDIRDEVTRHRTARRTRSVALVGGERRRGRGERYVAVRRADIEAEIGRRKEGFRDYGRVTKRAALRRVGRRSLRRWRKLKDGALGLPVIDTTGQVALVDYAPGDTVTVDIPGAYSGGQRIASITLVETEAGEYDPVIEFGAMTPDLSSGEDWSDDAATATRGGG